MKLDTTVKRISEFKITIADIWAMAECYHLKHARIMELRQQRLYDDSRYQSIPQWAKSELRGYDDAFFHFAFRHNLVWRVNLDGQYISGKDVPKGRWSEVKMGRHFWKDTDKHFTDEV